MNFAPKIYGCESQKIVFIYRKIVQARENMFWINCVSRDYRYANFVKCQNFDKQIERSVQDQQKGAMREFDEVPVPFIITASLIFVYSRYIYINARLPDHTL